MIDKDRVERMIVTLAQYKQGEQEVKESAALYSLFVNTLEGSLSLYNEVQNNKTYSALGIIGHYMNRQALKANAEKLMDEIGKDGLWVKSGKNQYKIRENDFIDIADLLNEADEIIGHLYNVKASEIDAISGVVSEMGKRYKKKN